jgi:hypothetical protein
MKFSIRKQRYPCADGTRPLSFAVYVRRGWRSHFCCYAWSFSRAWVATQLIKQTMKEEG